MLPQPPPADASPVMAAPDEAVVGPSVDTTRELPRAVEEAPAPPEEEPYVKEADILVTIAAPTAPGTPLP